MPIILNGTGTISGLTAGGLPSSSVTTANIADNAVTYAKIGTTEQGQLCKAWVNFNGTGTVAIRASYNVSSITDEGVGKFVVNFTTAFADTSYVLAGSGSVRDGTDDSNSAKVCHRRLSSSTLTTTACAITVATSGDNFADCVITCASFFR